MGYILHDVFKNMEKAFNLTSTKLFKPTVTTRQKKDSIDIGNTHPNFSGFNINIEIKNEMAPRMLIVSPTGKGKTTLASIIISQAYLNGITPIILHDYRNEYREMILKSANFFGTERFFEDEIVSIVPHFLKKANPELPFKDAMPFQFDFDDINIDDVNTLLGYTTKEDDVQSMGIEMLYSNLNPKERKISKIYEILRNPISFKIYTEGVIQKRTQYSILGRISRLFKNEVIGGKKEINIEELISSNKITNLCCFGEDESTINYVQAYIALLERKIKQFIMRNPIKILTVVDEAEKIIPAISNPSSKKELNDSVKRTRKWNESMLFISQLVSDLEKDIIHNCNYFFVNPLTNKEDIIYLLDNLNIREEVRFNIIYDYIPKMLEFIENKFLNPKKFIPWLKISSSGEHMGFFPFVRL